MASKLKLVFMGTPAFAVPSLQALHAAGHEIVAVYTQPPRPAGRGQKETPSPVHQFALAHGIPVYTPVSLKSEEAQSQFAAHKADAAIVAAYGLLLPKPILDAYPMGCINVHPSLLPRWRGAAPIQRTIMAGDHKTAIVIMQMDEGLDTGDMILLEPFGIPDRTTSGELHDRLAAEAGPLLLKALEGLRSGSITPVKQSEEGIEYAKKITKAEARIDWNQPAQRIACQVRGLNPAPGAYFLHHGEQVKLLEADERPLPYPAAPGTLLEANLIACGEGAIAPRLVQRPGKKPIGFEDMLRGHPIAPGTVLE